VLSVFHRIDTGVVTGKEVLGAALLASAFETQGTTLTSDTVRSVFITRRGTAMLPIYLGIDAGPPAGQQVFGAVLHAVTLETDLTRNARNAFRTGASCAISIARCSATVCWIPQRIDAGIIASEQPAGAAQEAGSLEADFTAFANCPV